MRRGGGLKAAVFATGRPGVASGRHVRRPTPCGRMAPRASHRAAGQGPRGVVDWHARARAQRADH